MEDGDKTKSIPYFLEKMGDAQFRGIGYVYFSIVMLILLNPRALAALIILAASCSAS